jgi:hypothetical protein
MAQVGSRRPLNVEARFRFRISPCEICGGQSDTGTVLQFAPVSIIPPTVHTHFIYVLILPEAQMGEVWEPSKKQCSFGNLGALVRIVLSLSL